jgi:hypothetical protein
MSKGGDLQYLCGKGTEGLGFTKYPEWATGKGGDLLNGHGKEMEG